MAALFSCNKGTVNEELSMEKLTVGFEILSVILNQNSYMY